jgi:RNA polymerase sigma-70 factor (ECF subfamily)
VDLHSGFGAFLDENSESVCRGLTVALGDARSAAEATQEAFTRAYVRWRHESQMERPAGWVYVTAVRYARRCRRTRPVELEAAVVEDVADLVTRRAALESALGLLAERQRLAVVLRYGLDLPLAQVAVGDGVRVGHSEVHAAHRGRATAGRPQWFSVGGGT